MPEPEPRVHLLRRMTERERLDAQIALLRAERARTSEYNSKGYLAAEIQRLEDLRDGTPAWEIAERRRRERMAFGAGTVEDWEEERRRLVEAKLPTTDVECRLVWLREKRHREQLNQAETSMRGWRILAWLLIFVFVMVHIGNCTRH